MAHYLLQVGYTAEAWAAIIATQQNRLDAVRPVIEKLVVESLLDQLLKPERVTAILATLKARRDDRQGHLSNRRRLQLLQMHPVHQKWAA